MSSPAASAAPISAALRPGVSTAARPAPAFGSTPASASPRPFVEPGTHSSPAPSRPPSTSRRAGEVEQRAGGLRRRAAR